MPIIPAPRHPRHYTCTSTPAALSCPVCIALETVTGLGVVTGAWQAATAELQATRRLLEVSQKEAAEDLAAQATEASRLKAEADTEVRAAQERASQELQEARAALARQQQVAKEEGSTAKEQTQVSRPR